jgi:hypothetical protein
MGLNDDNQKLYRLVSATIRRRFALLIQCVGRGNDPSVHSLHFPW